jgi:hypothetical protein
LLWPLSLDAIHDRSLRYQACIRSSLARVFPQAQEPVETAVVVDGFS